MQLFPGMFAWLTTYLQAHAMAVFPKTYVAASALEKKNDGKVTQPKLLL